MRFDAPQVLWMLLAVLAFGVAAARLLARRREALARFVEAGLIDRIVERLDGRRRTVRLRLRVLAMGLLVVALAGPLWGFRWEEIRREGIDLIVAIDTSRSMLTPDVAPNRLERAKLAVLDLVARLDGDRVGLVAFAGTAFLECPLTLDYAAFERTLRALYAGIIPRGGTSIARAIDESLASFEAREGKHQALILITDGEDHEGDVEAAAQRAKDAGVKVYAVGIGTTEGELVPAPEGGGARQSTPYLKDRTGNVVKSRLDASTLETVARATDGAYVRGVGPALGLDEVFRDHIATMERRDVASRMERRWEQRFQFPLGLAIVLLLVEAFVGDARALRTRAMGDARAPGTRAAGDAGGRRRSRWLERFGVRRSSTAAVVLAGLALGAEPALAAADPAVEGYSAYEKRAYDTAVERWREALIDEPDSPLLRFNLGAALYRAAQFQESAEAFAKVAAAADPGWTAKASYNLGNALYRTGEGTLSSDKQMTLQAWEQALVAYRAAMAADAADLEAKIAHEVVAERLRELREELEREAQEQQDGAGESEQQPQEQEQQQQQEPQPQEQAGDGAPQDTSEADAGEQTPPQDGQPSPQEPSADREEQAAPEPQAGEGEQAQNDASSEPDSQRPDDSGAAEEQAADTPPTTVPAAEAQAGGEDAQEQEAHEQAGDDGAAAGSPPRGDAQSGTQPPPAGATAYAGEEGTRDESREAAYAVLDAVRREELGPDEIDRGRAATAVAEPMKDW